ncbi:MAG TPA: protease complex subunit PrcB family protein [Pyrinomonadaceae bacterium]|nr:protease complex subunit PrcB family protein [Pyrinomonadaceae bacterium]
MVLKKFGTALMLASLAFSTASACAARPTTEGASGVDEQSKKKSRTTPTPTPLPSPDAEKNLETNMSGEIKELAAGGYSSVKEPFIIVARDAETYANVRKLNDKLPEFGADFFKSNAVVAAFLGQRRSGGYSVRITRNATGVATVLHVSEQPPPKDAIVTMALTSAFQIVSVSVGEERPLALELDATWQEAARPYKVDAGEFMRMGGFAGRIEKSTLKGDLRVMRHARLATIFFALQGTGAEGVYALQDVASGTVAPDGTLTLTRLDPGTFVPPPRNPLRARGSFSDNENQLSLTFEAMQAKVNDGYGGQGKLEATATAPPPKKRAVDDDPM